jgi:hypothetical protein
LSIDLVGSSAGSYGIHSLDRFVSTETVISWLTTPQRIALFASTV